MKSKPATALLRSDYLPWLAALKKRIRSAQLQAAARVNHELLRLYWDLGRAIAQAQQDPHYGKRIVERLAVDLQHEFPGVAGFSALNLWRMRAFYEAYRAHAEILSPPVTESPPPKAASRARRSRSGKLSPPVTVLGDTRESTAPSGPPEPFASLPWSHNLVLLHRVDSAGERAWYARAAVQHGWSRSVLVA